MLYLGAATGQVAAQPRQNESWRATEPVAAISPRLGDIAASPYTRHRLRRRVHRRRKFRVNQI